MEGKPERKGKLQDEREPDVVGKQGKQDKSEDEGKTRGGAKPEPQAKPVSKLCGLLKSTKLKIMCPGN